MPDIKSKIETECNTLEEYWSERNKEMKKWYDILLLTNNLAQEGMESVIANDPRVGFNLSLHLLTSSTISHSISTEGLEHGEIIDTSLVEQFFKNKVWRLKDKEQRDIGRQSWLRQFTSLMLATGWYSVFALATPDKLIAEIWNPAEVYPRFSRDPEVGLSACARIYPLSAMEANLKAKLNNWTLPRPFNTNIKAYNYFSIDEDGDVSNAMLLGNVMVIPPHKLNPNEQAFNRIPIFTSPVGGLPDDGVIMSGSKSWQRHFGESIIAVNADEFNNQNKMLTYTQQTVRDTATPRWFERSTGKPILTAETLFKRGAIFRGGPNDSIEPMPVPPMPVELRTIMFDYSNRIQRGLFPWALLGNIQQELSGYMMSQIASAAIGALTPYVDGLRNVLTDVDNYWLNEIKKRKLRPYKFEMPANIPDEAKFEVEFSINIPGSLVQRATVAKMLNPDLRFDFATTTDMMFPEITDPIAVQARVNKDIAMMGPIPQTVAAVVAYKEMAKRLREAGNASVAELYEKAASALEAQLAGPPQVPTTKPPPAQREVRTAAPREEGGMPGMGREGM